MGGDLKSASCKGMVSSGNDLQCLWEGSGQGRLCGGQGIFQELATVDGFVDRIGKLCREMVSCRNK